MRDSSLVLREAFLLFPSLESVISFFKLLFMIYFYLVL